MLHASLGVLVCWIQKWTQPPVTNLFPGSRWCLANTAVLFSIFCLSCSKSKHPQTLHYRWANNDEDQFGLLKRCRIAFWNPNHSLMFVSRFISGWQFVTLRYVFIQLICSTNYPTCLAFWIITTMLRRTLWICKYIICTTYSPTTNSFIRWSTLLYGVVRSIK